MRLLTTEPEAGAMRFGRCPTAEVTVDGLPALGTEARKKHDFEERIFAGVAFDRVHPEVLATRPHVGIGPGEIRSIVRAKAEQHGMDADAIFKAARKPIGWVESQRQSHTEPAEPAPISAGLWDDIYGETPASATTPGEGGG